MSTPNWTRTALTRPFWSNTQCFGWRLSRFTPVTGRVYSWPMNTHDLRNSSSPESPSSSSLTPRTLSSDNFQEIIETTWTHNVMNCTAWHDRGWTRVDEGRWEWTRVSKVTKMNKRRNKERMRVNKSERNDEQEWTSFRERTRVNEGLISELKVPGAWFTSIKAAEPRVRSNDGAFVLLLKVMCSPSRRELIPVA